MAHPRNTLQTLFCATALVLLVALLGACGEKAQTASRNAGESQAWNGAQPAFDAPGWKPGDKASWEEQIRQRNRQQNEYTRIAP
ncbi:hypothetical protein [Hydrogenophaga sp. BPS33]|uniref:hypothetical protein n=1 Tax=Hydrogenophaga sp. BPS33 TaxID=2651974 RepID=UPI001F169317|nr:hypothetical protein [Hydrogenophaga sp. BPS33]